MGKFKVGDRVEIIGDTSLSSNKPGDIGTITEIDKYNNLRVTVPLRNSYVNWQAERELKLVVEEVPCPNPDICEVIHKLSELDDRWIYKELDEHGRVIGINFMQGAADYDLFLKDYTKNDNELLASLITLSNLSGLSLVRNDETNRLIWTYVTLQFIREDQDYAKAEIEDNL